MNQPEHISTILPAALAGLVGANMRAADRKHECNHIKKQWAENTIGYRVARNMQGEWEIWIPDFLETKNSTVQGFVWRIKFCPFCGCELSDDKNSKQWK